MATGLEFIVTGSGELVHAAPPSPAALTKQIDKATGALLVKYRGGGASCAVNADESLVVADTDVFAGDGKPLWRFPDQLEQVSLRGLSAALIGRTLFMVAE